MNDLMVLDTRTKTTQDAIIDLISWSLNIPSARIYPYSNLIDDLRLDPLDKMLLIIELENRLNIYLSPEEAESIETVQDASFFFQQRAAA